MERPRDVRTGFSAPPWADALDPVAVLQRVPEDAVIAGMFLQGVLQALKRAGKPSPATRNRYLPFGFYPQREHAQLLVDACPLLFPGKTTRAALRSLGRGAPAALLQSTLGRVSLGAAQSAEDAIGAIVKTYPVNVRPSTAEVIDASATHAIVSLRGIGFFLDCHHVGVFEGTLRYAGVRGEVRIRVLRPGDADFLCTWHAPLATP